MDEKQLTSKRLLCTYVLYVYSTGLTSLIDASVLLYPQVQAASPC